MKVKICDAICGAGKTSAAINMMNRETDKKFIFVSQYLTEVERIKEACASREFVEPLPSGKSNPTKLTDIENLVREGKNIVTTHALFLACTDEIKRILIEQKYVMILDEVVPAWADADIADGDFNLLQRAGIVKKKADEGVDDLDWNWSAYDGENGRFQDEMKMSRSFSLKHYDGKCFFWTISPELFTCFTDVYVLTYLFQHQALRCFFDIHGIEYEFIGTKRTAEQFEFCPATEMDRRRDLRSKIHIIDKPKLNAMGAGRTALSHSWYMAAQKKPGAPELDKLRNNLRNALMNIMKARAADSMWCTYKPFMKAVKPVGYASCFVPFNKRASNEFADRTHLAYCVNVFPNPYERHYYKDHGTNIDGDMYAVSTLVQWMFRSAIRNGKDIYLYLPSLRMRSLLTQWLDNLAEGRDLDPVSYRMPHKSNYIPVAQRKKRGRKKNDN